MEFYTLKAYGEPENGNFLIIFAKSPVEGGAVRSYTVMSTVKYDYYKTLPTISHELGHLWNGRTIQHKDFSTKWFNEGGNEYISKLAMVYSGELSEEELLEELYKKWLYYEEKFVKEGRDRAISSAREYGLDDHLIYTKGELVSYLLDSEIKKRTNGQKSILDVTKYLYENDRLIEGNEDIRKAVEAVTGLEFTDFFEDYVYGTESIEFKINLVTTTTNSVKEAVETETATPTSKPKSQTPGFEAILAITGIAAVSYLLRKTSL